MLEILIIFFGLFCIGFSFVLSHRFNKIDLHIAKALAWQLRGEAFIGFVIVFFSVMAVLDLSTYFTGEIALAVRWAAFLVGAVTSWNLYQQILIIEKLSEKHKKVPPK